MSDPVRDPHTSTDNNRTSDQGKITMKNEVVSGSSRIKLELHNSSRFWTLVPKEQNWAPIDYRQSVLYFSKEYILLCCRLLVCPPSKTVNVIFMRNSQEFWDSVVWRCLRNAINSNRNYRYFFFREFPRQQQTLHTDLRIVWIKNVIQDYMRRCLSTLSVHPSALMACLARTWTLHMVYKRSPPMGGDSLHVSFLYPPMELNLQLEKMDFQPRACNQRQIGQKKRNARV